MNPDSLTDRRRLLWGWVLLVLLAGCRGQQPSVLDPPADGTWYERQAAKLEPFRNNPSPLTETCVLSVSVSEDHCCWLEQRGSEVQLWVAPTSGLEQARQVASRPLEQGFFELNMAPDGTACLLLRADPALSDPRQQAVLERWDLTTGKHEEISRTASAYFLPSWLKEGSFVFAETSAGFMRVLEQRPDGSRIQALAHEAKYPRLVISALASGSYVIYDRNRPTDTHCWVRMDGVGWRELWSRNHQIRLLEVSSSRGIVLVRDDEDSSRILQLSQKSLDPGRGKLQPEGEELLALGVADFALMQGRHVVYLERSTWGHELKVLDLESRRVQEVSFLQGAGLGRKFQPAGTTRASFLFEGPLQPLSAGMVDLERGEFLSLRASVPEGLKQVQIEVGSGRVTLAPADHAAPTMLEAYGAFRQTVLPRWDWARAEWLRRGGRVVIEQLESLPLEQEKARDQLLAVARELGTDSLVLRGQSAGGTLALMALVEGPSLFKAVWADAPVTDLVDFARLAPGDLWVGEFGDATVPEERERLLKLSPLHRVSRQTYPLTLLSSAADDKAVDPRHATRFAQRMEEMAESSPIYFLLEEQGIHGKFMPRRDDLSVAVELLWQAATP